MAKTNKNLFTIIINMVQIYLQQLGNLAHLAVLEIELARKTFIKIVILLIISSMLICSTWLALMFTLFFYLNSLALSYFYCALILTLFNFLLLCCTCLLILYFKKYLFLPSTRKQISRLFLTKKE